MAQQQTPAAGSGKPAGSVLDHVPSQPLQAGAVCTPVRRTARGDAAVVVEVYALGSGVAVKGQGGDLSAREGAFELETHGKPLVFHPLGARTAHWQVTAIQGDVAPVGLALKGMHQEQLAEIGNGLSHGNPPLKTVILSLPPATGKSTVAPTLARLLGCTRIVDEWNPRLSVLRGALHLTNCAVPA